jgi:hypothetical protein
MTDQYRETLNQLTPINSDEISPNFAVVLMIVNRVDYVLDEGFGKRLLYTRKDNEWQEQEVCP